MVSGKEQGGDRADMEPSRFLKNEAPYVFPNWPLKSYRGPMASKEFHGRTRALKSRVKIASRFSTREERRKC